MRPEPMLESAMYSFRNEPDAIDRLHCERCGHDLWAHCNADRSLDASSVCPDFILPDFTAIIPTLRGEHVLQS